MDFQTICQPLLLSESFGGDAQLLAFFGLSLK
jgi:hypothetical protein